MSAVRYLRFRMRRDNPNTICSASGTLFSSQYVCLFSDMLPALTVNEVPLYSVRRTDTAYIFNQFEVTLHGLDVFIEKCDFEVNEIILHPGLRVCFWICSRPHQVSWVRQVRTVFPVTLQFFFLYSVVSASVFKINYFSMHCPPFRRNNSEYLKSQEKDRDGSITQNELLNNSQCDDFCFHYVSCFCCSVMCYQVS